MRQAISHRVVLESVDGDSYSAQSPMESPDPLWAVALVYWIAYAVGENPTAAVAEDLGVSRGAAAQRVKRARDAGYLPPTTSGRAS